MLRTDPIVDEKHENIPKDIQKEITDLFKNCFITSTFGGTAYGHTKDEKTLERLTEGWAIGQHEDALGNIQQTRVACNSSLLGSTKASHDKNAPTYYDFNIPPALVNLVREINDAK